MHTLNKDMNIYENSFKRILHCILNIKNTFYFYLFGAHLCCWLYTRNVNTRSCSQNKGIEFLFSLHALRVCTWYLKVTWNKQWVCTSLWGNSEYQIDAAIRSVNLNLGRLYIYLYVFVVTKKVKLCLVIVLNVRYARNKW